MEIHKAAISIIKEGIDRVLPNNLIQPYLQTNEKGIIVNGELLKAEDIENIYVIGFGKAAAAMAAAIEEILGDKITSGLIITKYEHSIPLKYIHCIEAAHPVPDANGVKGAQEIDKILHKSGERDLIICLISGGGSALLADIPEAISLEDIKLMNATLLRSGYNIKQINEIRIALSTLKGGKLLQKAFPAKLISFILSDVVGDPIESIASGPTALFNNTSQDFFNFFCKSELFNELPLRIQLYLKNYKKTIVDTEGWYRNILTGSNRIALQAAKEKAEALGYNTSILSSELEGEVENIAKQFISKLNNCSLNKPFCILAGGEPVVTFNKSGKGGRNQHLSLLMAQALNGQEDVVFASVGTDGTDGPTDAAGAWVDGNTQSLLEKNGKMASEYTKNYDSYHYFSNSPYHIITGPTGTNVMDIMILIKK